MTQFLESTADSAVNWTKTDGNVTDVHYHDYLQNFQAGFLRNISDPANTGTFQKLYKTANADKLWDIYMSGFPEAHRAYHNCSSCRKFVTNFGSLVTLDKDGNQNSAFFQDADSDDIHRESARLVREALAKARLSGVFVTTKKEWAASSTNEKWVHYHATPPWQLVHSGTFKRMQEYKGALNTQFEMMQQTLGEYSQDLLSRTLTIMNSGAFEGAESSKAMFQWLHDLHAKIAEFPKRRANLLWHAVATAPAGFANMRQSVGASLLDDLKDGLDVEHAKRKFVAKMDPLKYRRAQVAPTEGNLKRAEEIVGELGVASALKRRIAQPHELQYLWQRQVKAAEPAAAGVFGHLKAKDSEPKITFEGNTSEITITWDKFRRTVLPIAESMQVYVGAGLQSFLVFTTAVDPEAEPILQWDNKYNRNPVAHYQWSQKNGIGQSIPGSPSHQHNLGQHTFHPVTGIVLNEAHWESETLHSHIHPMATFIIEGAVETKFDAGLALFPQVLKTELHSIGRTIEAYSNAGSMKDVSPGPHAVGLVAPQSPQGRPIQIKVKSNGQTLNYKIDRWD